MTTTQADLTAISSGASQVTAVNDAIRAIGNSIRTLADGMTAHYNTPAGYAIQAAAYHWYDLLNGGNGVTKIYDDVVTGLMGSHADWTAQVQNDLTAANNVASALMGAITNPTSVL